MAVDDRVVLFGEDIAGGAGRDKDYTEAADAWGGPFVRYHTGFAVTLPRGAQARYHGERRRTGCRSRVLAPT